MHYIIHASFYSSRGAKATSRPSINEWLYFEQHLIKANGEWKKIEAEWDQLHVRHNA
jgi:hypothetical protein